MSYPSMNKTNNNLITYPDTKHNVCSCVSNKVLRFEALRGVSPSKQIKAYGYENH
jgi:hypothetical protein